MAWYERRACAWCGTEFVPVRDTARYCSATCRSRAHRGQEVARDGTLAQRAK